MEFREEHGLNEIAEPLAVVKGDPELEHFWPGQFAGFTRDGSCPVRVARIYH